MSLTEQQNKDLEEFSEKVKDQMIAFGRCYLKIPKSLEVLLGDMEGAFPATPESKEIAEMYESATKTKFVIKPLDIFGCTESEDVDNSNNPESSDI